MTLLGIVNTPVKSAHLKNAHFDVGNAARNGVTPTQTCGIFNQSRLRLVEQDATINTIPIACHYSDVPVRLTQLVNTSTPMLMTLLGIVTLVRRRCQSKRTLFDTS